MTQTLLSALVRWSAEPETLAVARRQVAVILTSISDFMR